VVRAFGFGDAHHRWQARLDAERTGAQGTPLMWYVIGVSLAGPDVCALPTDLSLAFSSCRREPRLLRSALEENVEIGTGRYE